MLRTVIAISQKNMGGRPLNLYLASASCVTSVIHSIFELGKKNKHSLFVSTTSLKEEAENFKGGNSDNILILYWLPIPIERFGIDIGIIHQMAELILENELPAYYSEFFPKIGEFSVKGALLKEHIIGYLEGNKLIISPRLISYPKFDENTIEDGFYIDDSESQLKSLKKTSNYSRQFLLSDNLFSYDKNC